MEFAFPTSFPLEKKVLTKWKHLLDEKKFKALQESSFIDSFPPVDQAFEEERDLQPIPENYSCDLDVRKQQIENVHKRWMMELQPIEQQSYLDDPTSRQARKQSFQNYVDSFNKKRYLSVDSGLNEEHQPHALPENHKEQMLASKSMETISNSDREPLKLPPINQRFPGPIYVDVGAGPLNYWQTAATDNFIDSELRRRTRLRMKEKMMTSQVCMNYEEENEDDPELVGRELGLSKKRPVVKGPKETNTHSRWLSQIPGLSWEVE
ncbi:uncharacterized protein LOC111088099 [Limulus polyphemus]|uniref:Uncharacterized protein LOC111088099 n=1 Tax=Limulus polyphemus TaxID=6850 RepID=A0ABM1TA64_LIMPO|nr:uncharacterized protein LOC111088099 [Limulus polyphemus]